MMIVMNVSNDESVFIGADFLGALVATAPGEKIPHRAPPCEELDPPYTIKLVFVQKITFVLRIISKNCCHHSFVGWSFAPRPHWGGYSATPDSLAVFRQFRGLTSKQRGGERRGREGRGEKEFVLCPSKKKEKSAPTVQLLTSADNVALTPFIRPPDAAAAAQLLLTAGSPAVQQSIYISWSPGPQQ